MPKIITDKKGFSLVETLVAISILSLSITATFTAVQSGIRNSTIAKDQITAFYLAQEVMEYIKNIRDENALYSIQNPNAPRDWLYGVFTAGSPCELGKVCMIDTTLSSNNIIACGLAVIEDTPPSLCVNLNQEELTGLFGYNSNWKPTNFKREIQIKNIENIEANSEVEVVVSMSWTSRAGIKNFQITERLFNRQ